ncbi:GHMP kinase [Motiliproteus coralliicola]|uniref:GHMP kinase n=1 Tax=Motiliproteus coralliicola TaxID=2283196 RepID=A0A369WTF1_9GAMM|nr:GHMP kinase [Motiliproteus coralliicola]RDE24972.1 GHMP kinase [Motiliproteus coralliicola]
MNQIDSSIRASAPGTLMLLGEHAVLHGSRALVLAVDKRIRVELTPLDEPQLEIESALGQYRAPIDQRHADATFSFILAAFEHCYTAFAVEAGISPGTGVRLQVESDFSHLVGLGSSAAVTVATLAVLNRWLGQSPNSDQLFEQARAVMLRVQGRGSGADLAAAIEGGMVAYHQSGERQKLAPLPSIGLYYCGYKLKTPLVLERVAEAAEQLPLLYQHLYQLMAECAEQACEAAGQGDWTLLGRLMNYYQGLMDALGVNDAKLSQMIYQLRGDSLVQGAKISGSGLGDCVISLGQPQAVELPDRIPVQVASLGLRLD